MAGVAAKPVSQLRELRTPRCKHLASKRQNPASGALLAVTAVHRGAASHVQVKGSYSKTGRATQFVATGLSREGAFKYMFPFTNKEDGTETQMSVATYFTKHLGIKLAFPHLQCVTVRRSTLSLLQLPTLAQASASWSYACSASYVCGCSLPRVRQLLMWCTSPTVVRGGGRGGRSLLAD